MNTPAHLLLGAALFSRAGDASRTRASLLGALLPDLSLYVLAGVSLFVLNIPGSRVFGELYFSDTWQTIFAIDNSLVLWTIALAAFAWRRWGPGIALCGAALAHILTDLPLHHDDGRAHFWPVSNWIFESPMSYWDSAHHAGLVAPAALALCAVCAFVLWRRFPGVAARAGIALLLALEIWTARQWIMFF